MHYLVRSPILILIFNRPETTFRVFERIKQVQPKRLYIAADGPRSTKPNESFLCERARSIVEMIDWPCDVRTLFNIENKGCRIAVSDAITWFFEQEEEGIILEDDCLPATSFFYFCDSMLEHYRNDTRIHVITGTNLQMGKKWGDASYYFSQYSNIWGWAGWKRIWKDYDRDLKKYSEQQAEQILHSVFDDRFLIEDWLVNFRKLKSGEIDTWDHQLNFLSFFEHALCVTPNVNLISNIGFGEDATHTLNPDNHHANLNTGEITTITHPETFLPQKEADYFFLRKEHNLDERWRLYNKPKKRFKRWIKNLFRPAHNH